MRGIETYSVDRWPWFRGVRDEVMLPCVDLLDVGAGIRPQCFVRCENHICVEPHGEYADVLESSGFSVIRKTALDALADVPPVDTIVAIDVIEHMEKADGLAFIDAALSKARKQVVIFTPLGFMPQSGGDESDPWGMQGQHWQRHRSGWTPDDFPGFRCFVNNRFKHRKNCEPQGAFFAVHTQ